MDITLPDLSGLTAIQIGTFAAMLAVIDLAWNVIENVAHKTFDPSKVADFLVSHVVQRVFPIYALAIIGAGNFGLPPFAPFGAAAMVGLGAYAVETLGSLYAATKSAPAA